MPPPTPYYPDQGGLFWNFLHITISHQTNLILCDRKTQNARFDVSSCIRVTLFWPKRHSQQEQVCLSSSHVPIFTFFVLITSSTYEGQFPILLWCSNSSFVSTGWRDCSRCYLGTSYLLNKLSNYFKLSTTLYYPFIKLPHCQCQIFYFFFLVYLWWHTFSIVCTQNLGIKTSTRKVWLC
jgi:hypothetical protein